MTSSGTVAARDAYEPDNAGENPEAGETDITGDSGGNLLPRPQDRPDEVPDAGLKT